MYSDDASEMINVTYLLSTRLWIIFRVTILSAKSDKVLDNLSQTRRLNVHDFSKLDHDPNENRILMNNDWMQ